VSRQSKAAATLMMVFLMVSACAPAGSVTPDSIVRPVLADGWQAFKADSGYEIRYPVYTHPLQAATGEEGR